MNIDQYIKALQRVDVVKLARLKQIIELHQDIAILGNGGSNSIASHISQDYTKQLKKRAFSFSDPSRLTCYINDYGMENAYVQFLKEFATQETLAILITSSGESDNIYNAATFCRDNQIPFILLTGFDKNNRTREFRSEDSELDFWVDSHDYGVVECTHQTILHTVIS